MRTYMGMPFLTPFCTQIEHKAASTARGALTQVAFAGLKWMLYPGEYAWVRAWVRVCVFLHGGTGLLFVAAHNGYGRNRLWVGQSIHHRHFCPSVVGDACCREKNHVTQDD